MESEHQKKSIFVPYQNPVYSLKVNGLGHSFYSLKIDKQHYQKELAQEHLKYKRAWI